LAVDNFSLPKIQICIDEIKTRKAHVTLITDNPILFKGKNVDILLEVPQAQYFQELMCLYPVQLLVNEICILKNLNPDKPRNLAKTVTVE
jgi:glucosamine--fructose-6-phosphate aminotransferase (isomerizing)